MSQFEEYTPDDSSDFDSAWRNAFDEAAETPPPRVWDAIERQLDESENPKILPLWGLGWSASRPVVWGVGIAAAVVLLLVGWWATFQQPGLSEQPVAQQSAPAPQDTESNLATTGKGATEAPASGQAATVPVGPSTPDIAQNDPTESVAGSRRPTESAHTSDQARSERPSTAPASGRPGYQLPADRYAGRRGQVTDRDLLAGSTSRRPSRTTSTPAMGEENRMNATTFAEPTAPSVVPNNIPEPTVLQVSSMNLERLANRPVQFKQLYGTQRIIWFRAPEPTSSPESEQPKNQSRELWASVSVMPGAFNSSVSVRQAMPTPTLTAMNSNAFVQNTPAYDRSTVTSRANFSVAYQATAGIQMNEHWTIETGVGYLQGRSTVESPAQLSSSYVVRTTELQAASGNSSNLYVDALRNSLVTSAGNALNAASDYKGSFVSNTMLSNPNVAANVYDEKTRQATANDYVYVQVPVQVGYQIRPRNRLSFTVLGGMLTNWFVRNTVANDLTISAGDGVYRPVSLAATMGLRFRYRPTQRWSASLAGMYQPSLQSGTRPQAGVSNRPTATGMSFGLDYHF
ncbi:hypothetical protein BN8_06036 [Fibrisoma limi BUZ 3]|uniref:Outer membrane protein beta-barrel domain-containing protein n=1 Tax=Fibrisoma limi BUZ 3 TaxID=1185876 RepID=I2GRX8_9BACT|nr:anti-sigma factor [Fibrisoma limi]CCH56656.1 hypothetical protein BN8_06036 [Fibrisoma limi BUZ 3]